jgi:putative membrane protein
MSLQLAADLAVAGVALLHLLFMGLEMFLWNRPVGRRIFGLDPEFARRSAALAANQGLYNGFLAAGLGWGLLAGPDGLYIKVFFLACVIVAGIFGALTVRRSILWIQAVPGMIALALVYLAG